MFKKALSVILAATLCMGCMMVNAISVEKPATEEPYYSETVYYTGEDLSKVKAVKSENPGESLVGVIEKTVYVSETTDKTGNVVDSHLMTKSEVEEYREGLSNITPRDSTLIGQDNTKEEALTISLSVFRQSDNTYKAYGSAKWASSGGSTEGKPAVGKDYIAITWGGGGDLVQKSKQIAGTYYNGKSVTFSQAKADSYKGYCWQFNELSGSSRMKTANPQIHLKKTYSTNRGRKTNVRLTYIHTYQTTTGSISISGGTSGVAAGVSLSNTDKSWQVEIDVSGISY